MNVLIAGGTEMKSPCCNSPMVYTENWENYSDKVTQYWCDRCGNPFRMVVMDVRTGKTINYGYVR